MCHVIKFMIMEFDDSMNVITCFLIDQVSESSIRVLSDFFHILHVYGFIIHLSCQDIKGQALTLRIFHTCLRKNPLYNKLGPEKNLLVLIKNPIFIANIYVFYACPRTSTFCTLLVPVQMLLFTIYLTIGQSLMSSPEGIHVH